MMVWRTLAHNGPRSITTRVKQFRESLVDALSFSEASRIRCMSNCCIDQHLARINRQNLRSAWCCCETCDDASGRNDACIILRM